MNIGLVELVLTVAVLLATILGFWVNLNNDVTKIKARMYHLEDSDAELKVILADISTRLHHIEILLAANKIKD
jgi:hypothetical protein|tara:strand:+ start:462 stop:680 length:219 start_codon:yes stop_codon:yes gene_type:complete